MRNLKEILKLFTESNEDRKERKWLENAKMDNLIQRIKLSQSHSDLFDAAHDVQNTKKTISKEDRDRIHSAIAGNTHADARTLNFIARKTDSQLVLEGVAWNHNSDQATLRVVEKKAYEPVVFALLNHNPVRQKERKKKKQVIEGQNVTASVKNNQAGSTEAGSIGSTPTNSATLDGWASQSATREVDGENGVEMREIPQANAKPKNDTVSSDTSEALQALKPRVDRAASNYLNIDNLVASIFGPRDGSARKLTPEKMEELLKLQQELKEDLTAIKELISYHSPHQKKIDEAVSSIMSQFFDIRDRYKQNPDSISANEEEWLKEKNLYLLVNAGQYPKIDYVLPKELDEILKLETLKAVFAGDDTLEEFQSTLEVSVKELDGIINEASSLKVSAPDADNTAPNPTPLRSQGMFSSQTERGAEKAEQEEYTPDSPKPGSS